LKYDGNASHVSVAFYFRMECEKQVKGFAYARYKKFTTEQEALEFVKSTGLECCFTDYLKAWPSIMDQGC
jgi:viroplasmin and RNaseH domain-containing protein